MCAMVVAKDPVDVGFELCGHTRREIPVRSLEKSLVFLHNFETCIFVCRKPPVLRGLLQPWPCHTAGQHECFVCNRGRAITRPCHTAFSVLLVFWTESPVCTIMAVIVSYKEKFRAVSCASSCTRCTLQVNSFSAFKPACAFPQHVVLVVLIQHQTASVGTPTMTP